MENYALSKIKRPGFLAPTIAIIILYFGLNAISSFNFTGRLERIANEQGVEVARQRAKDKINSYDTFFEELFWGPKAAAQRYLDDTRP